MILKEIELNGFKSFKEKTKLVFDADVVAIVGPNGAGKSNIVDAVKWLLGEQSHKDIRTTDTSGLIFASPDEKDNLNVCSVAVTLDNPQQIENWRPGMYRVEKRYYRDEEAEYLINGEKVRLKDIRRLLAGMGIGLDNLSIVSQGEIGSFLSLVPTDRRLVFEEVAQLSHFKANKRRILNDLERTARNLERLEDNLVDRRTHLTRLGEQAEIARKHTAFSEEHQYCRGNLLAVDLIHCDRNHSRHERRIDENGRAHKELTGQHEKCNSEIYKGEGELEELRNARQDAVLAVEQYKNRVEAKRHEFEKAELAIEHGQESLKSKVDAVEEKRRQKILFAEEESEAKHRISDLTAKSETTQSDEEETRSAHLEHIEELRGKNEKLQGLEKKWEQSKNTLEEKSKESTETKLVLKSLQDSASSIEKTKAELSVKRDGFNRELEELHTESAQLSVEMEEVEERKKSSFEEHSRLDNELDELQTRQSELLKDESSCHGELLGLERLERERSGLGAGAKAVLDERDSSGRFSGIIGTLSDLVSVKGDYEFALEAIIGDRLRYLIAKTKDDAISAIDWVKETGVGQVSIIPLDEVEPFTPRALPPGLEGEDGFVLKAIEALEFDPALEKAVRYAVGDALIVTNLSAGMGFRNKYRLRQKMATSDGDLIYPSGVLRGGRARQPSAGLLARKARIEKLGEDLSNIKRQREKNAVEIAETKRKANEIDEEYTKADEASRKLSTRGMEIEGRIYNLESNLVEAESNINELDVRSKDEAKTASELKERLSVLSGDIEKLKAEVNQGKARVSGLREEIEESRAELNNERTKLERYAILIASYGDEIRRLEESIKRRDEESARIDEEIARAEVEVGEYKDSIANKEKERDEFKVEIERLEADFPSVTSKEKELERQIDEKKHSVEKLKEKGEKLNAEIRGIEDDIHKSEVKIAALESERQSLSAELSNHFPKVFEDFEAGMLVAKELGAKGALRQRIEELDAEIDALGEINQLAITEYERVREEISFKEEQRDDTIAARAELEKNLAEVEHKSRQVFMEVFEKTNKHFDEVFRRLFPGGQASVSLTDPSDPLESGIDIRARFPGKKEVDIIQFSGGERAIVAIALLFAFLRVKPSTCTVLDEVEAALDDINVGKFLSLVNDFLPERQFIIITHNKGTMEFARRLYGITMRRDGISRVVSVNLREWDEAVLGSRTGSGLEEVGMPVKRLPKPKSN